MYDSSFSVGRDIPLEKLRIVLLAVLKKLELEVLFFTSDGRMILNVRKTSWNSAKMKFYIQPEDEKVRILTRKKVSKSTQKVLDLYVSEIERIFCKIVENYEEIDLAKLTRKIESHYEHTPVLNQEEEKEYYQGFWAVFWPKKRFMTAQILVSINILIFVLMMISGVSALDPSPHDLHIWGGNFKLSIISGEWYRLFTTMFIHAGFLHLLPNMVMLLLIALKLEPIVKSSFLLVAYLFTGLLASIISVAYHPAGIVIVGASGAVFGLTGLLIVVLIHDRNKIVRKKKYIISIIFFVINNLLQGAKVPEIDNVSHLVGLLSGLLLGVLYYKMIEPNKGRARYAVNFALFLAVFSLAFWTGRKATIEYTEFNESITKLKLTEKRGSEAREVVFNALSDSTLFHDHERLDSLKEIVSLRLSADWDDCVQLLETLETNTYTPANFVEKRQVFLAYYSLLALETELLLKALDSPTDEIFNQLRSNIIQIQATEASLQSVNS